MAQTWRLTGIVMVFGLAACGGGGGVAPRYGTPDAAGLCVSAPSACAGNVLGKWKRDAICVTAFQSECESVHKFTQYDDQTLTFTADTVTFAGAGTTKVAIVFNRECNGDDACADENEDTLVCVDQGADDCHCTATFVDSGSSSTRPYTITGNVLTETFSNGSTSDTPFCVDGDYLYFIDTGAVLRYRHVD